jgi:DNA repair exonuclease SbcCD ATPase subunit
MDSLNEKIREIEMRIKNATVKLEELKPLIDETLQSRIEEANTALDTARSEYRTLTDKLATEKANLKHAKDALIDLENKENEIKLLENDRYIALRELADWRLIEQGSGQNGIQALELDALSPTIAAVATELLKEYEDGRFSIRFDTTREGNKGNQIEDFIIWVIDSRDGDEQEFETLSGGEAVWVRRALQDAFSIVRGNNSGVKFLTGFLDESDSALDFLSKVTYFHMIQAAHGQSKRLYTIMVTHTVEVQEMISQKIDVTELGSEAGK